jgi:uncharacterized protein YjiS (DUF1127 family)
MVVKLSLVAVGPLVDWLGRRAEQKALLKATNELSLSRDDMLNDIGISRDDITYAFRSRGRAFGVENRIE